MRTVFPHWTWPTVATVAMVWGVACLGQGLEIEIPVPEAGKVAADGKEAGKGSPPQRRENSPATRRGRERQPAEASAAGNRGGRAAMGDSIAPRGPGLIPTPVREPPSWEEAIRGDSSALPAWANPASAALRQREPAASAPMPEPPERRSASTSPSSRRTPTGRGTADTTGATPRNGWWGRWSLFSKGPSQSERTDPSATLARRHRVASRENAQDPLAPPSPWGERH